jgi:hypothetical protein
MIFIRDLNLTNLRFSQRVPGTKNGLFFGFGIKMFTLESDFNILGNIVLIKTIGLYLKLHKCTEFEIYFEKSRAVLSVLFVL